MSIADRQFFDTLADTWDERARINPDKISHIMDVSQIDEGERVLDVGTGTGVLIPFIEERLGGRGHIDAIDISEKMLDKAKQKYGHFKNVDFRITDVEEDAIETVYDRIFMYCVYPHFEWPIDTLKWLSTVCLSPLGSITVAFPESRLRINGIHHHNDGSCHSDHLEPAERYRKMLEAEGLKIDYFEDNDDFYIFRVRNINFKSPSHKKC